MLLTECQLFYYKVGHVIYSCILKGITPTLNIIKSTKPQDYERRFVSGL